MMLPRDPVQVSFALFARLCPFAFVTTMPVWGHAMAHADGEGGGNDGHRHPESGRHHDEVPGQ